MRVPADCSIRRQGGVSTCAPARPKEEQASPRIRMDPDPYADVATRCPLSRGERRAAAGERGACATYFSVVQRKVVTPNDFDDLDTLEQRLLACGRRYEQIAEPFEWKFGSSPVRTSTGSYTASTATSPPPPSRPEATAIRDRTSEPAH